MIHVLVVVEKNTNNVVEEMHRTVNIKKTLLIILSLLFVFTSCNSARKVRSISEDKLFSLNYGNFEEQINLFGINNVGNVSTSVTMQDGFFYVVNGESQKIMSLNSYGDLLSVYYNEDEYANKKSGLPLKSTSGIWKPIEYPFSYTGKIAVDSRKYIYVVGSVPKERNEQSESENLLYSQVVLCLSSDGSFVDYIGQQGRGGTPFPFIKEIYTTENDELVVVCVTMEGLCVYWFSETGTLRYQIPILTKDVPKLSQETLNTVSNVSDLFITIENVIPDCYAERLYIKVDYYLPHIDIESKVQSGIDYIESLVYPLNIDTGFYGESVNIPPYEEFVTEDFSKITYKLPYGFLGVTKNGWFFFIITTIDGFSIEMIQPGTQNVIKRNFDVNHQDVLYYSLSLSHEGIISALLANKDKVDVVWWRTDSLIDVILKS